jgi:hypothetical protein
MGSFSCAEGDISLILSGDFHCYAVTQVKAYVKA